MVITLINLTPHHVTVFTDAGEVTFAATGTFARLAETKTSAADLTTAQGDVPTEVVTYHGLTDLPDPQPGMAYLVSRVVAAESDRTDLYFPSGEVRDKDGRIIGCRTLGRFEHADNR
ncbi:hypothetical protein [Granulicoccus sp. GXG6511]|uniref:hypothetical protein n=1 Tax=Granulicoccus sp. GXG6511 TaxID=3381351 RepID=UPI003D7C4EA2